jgi:hypothetical protein
MTEFMVDGRCDNAKGMASTFTHVQPQQQQQRTPDCKKWLVNLSTSSK